MMNNKQIIPALALTTLLSMPALAGNISSEYREAALKEVCQSVQSNKPHKLFSSLGQHRLNMKTINAKLMCNNESVYDFALTHNAHRTANMLNEGQVAIKDIAYNQDKIYITLD